MIEPAEPTASRRGPADEASRPRWLLGGLAALFLLGLGFATWMHARALREVDALQDAMTARHNAPVALGLEARGAVLELTAALVAGRFARDPTDEQAQFQAVARRLGELIVKAKTAAPDGTVLARIEVLEQALGTYLTHAAALLAEGPSPLRRDTVESAQLHIQQLAAPLFRACNELRTTAEVAQEAAAGETRERLVRLKRIQRFSSGLFLLAGLMGSGLAYAAARGVRRVPMPGSPAQVRQEKLASLGTLAAGVAHEIRNPLTAIKLRLFSLNQSLPAEWANHEDVQVIGSELSRLERIVKGLLDFARPDRPALAEVCASRLLEDVQVLLAPELNQRRIRVVLDATPPLPVRADRQQLQQVLINLVQNAADSIHADGTITLRAARGASRLGGRSQATVLLEVADTGPGIPAAAQRRLFDPFFSTKEGGTGLGLAVAARIVENHGGLIQYQTQTNRGTMFQVVLPDPDRHANPGSAR